MPKERFMPEGEPSGGIESSVDKGTTTIDPDVKVIRDAEEIADLYVKAHARYDAIAEKKGLTGTTRSHYTKLMLDRDFRPYIAGKPVDREGPKPISKITPDREAKDAPSTDTASDDVELPELIERIAAETVPLPNFLDRRNFVDNGLSRYEAQARAPFERSSAEEMIDVLQQNIKGIERLRPELAGRLNNELKTLVDEINSRWWLHNFHLQMFGGNFAEAAQLSAYMDNFLPKIVETTCLVPKKEGEGSRKLVEEALLTLEGGQKEYAYFRKNVVDRKKQKDAFLESVDEKYRHRAEAAFNLAEKVLTSLGVSSTASIILKDNLPTEYEGLPQLQKIAKIKELDWYKQLELIDLKASFKNAPTDLSKTLFYGYLLEKTAAEEEPDEKGRPKKGGNPRSMPSMRRNMNFAITDYLSDAKSRVKKDEGKGIEGEKEPPSILTLIERLKAAGDVIDTGAGAEDTEAIVAKIDQKDALNPTGPGALSWIGSLNRYKEFTSAYDGYAAHPNLAGIKDILGAVGKFPSAELKEQIGGKVLENSFTFETAGDKVTFFNEIPMSNDIAATIFEVGRKAGIISLEKEDTLRQVYVGKGESFKYTKKLLQNPANLGLDSVPLVLNEVSDFIMKHMKDFLRYTKYNLKRAIIEIFQEIFKAVMSGK